MKKILTAALIMSALTFVSLPTKAEVIEKDKGYISVSQSCTKEVSPNQAKISIEIETSDKSLQKASEENKIIANKVYSTLKSLIKTTDYVKTGSYSANPQYSYTKENKRIFDKYVVSNTVVVRTKSIELVPKLIETAITQGATSVNNLQFSATDYDSLCNEALAELTQKASAQANLIAGSIKSQITGIKTINANCNLENNSRPTYAMMSKGAAENDSSTPIESGKLKIYANVDASFYVK